MRKILVVEFFTAYLFFGCATPQTVKDLSYTQLEYQRKYYEGMSVYTQSVLELAQQIKAEAIENINSITLESIDLLEKQTATEIKNIENFEERKRRLEKLREDIAEREKKASESKTSLEKDYEVIRDKTVELVNFLQKIIQAQETLNNYIHTEKVDEAIVNRLKTEITILMPKIGETAKQIEGLIKKLPIAR